MKYRRASRARVILECQPYDVLLSFALRQRIKISIRLEYDEILIQHFISYLEQSARAELQYCMKECHACCEELHEGEAQETVSAARVGSQTFTTKGLEQSKFPY